MILRTSPTSPYGRKVKIIAKLLGIFDQIEIMAVDLADPQDSLRQQNPLGKIPVLILKDGTNIYDSRVIAEYLNDTFNGSFFPKGEEKYQNLLLQATADGISDAAVALVLEKRFRSEEMVSDKWLNHQAGKIERAIALLESHPPTSGDNINIGHISLACALSFLDLRCDGEWRKSCPKLVAWLDDFAKQVPAYDETSVENSS